MTDLTIVKIVVSHRQTDLSTLGNDFFLLWVPLQNGGPRVKELLVDGNLGLRCHGIAVYSLAWFFFTIKKFGTEANFYKS
jgi:hypothetical protein